MHCDLFTTWPASGRCPVYIFYWGCQVSKHMKVLRKWFYCLWKSLVHMFFIKTPVDVGYNVFNIHYTSWKLYRNKRSVTQTRSPWRMSAFSWSWIFGSTSLISLSHFQDLFKNSSWCPNNGIPSGWFSTSLTIKLTLATCSHLRSYFCPANNI